ncbi:MAG TPA: tetratricopeptide repeat protein [bacterium]|nr:tetratricopeptide repeat protein [bacterium]HPN44865.1 tetratricopeptide repeat protein [bacterium]
MKNCLFNKIFLFIILFLSTTPFYLQTGFAQESAFVSAILKETGEDLVKLSEIIREHETLLQKYPKGPFASTIMFQLAELEAQKSNIIYQQEMRLYEEDLKNFDAGKLAVEPEMPKLNMDRTIQYCNVLLKEYPNSKFQDKILYKLGISYFQEGDKLRAKDYFESIVANYPESTVSLESHFRIGEYYFDKRDLDNAIFHYSKLLVDWNNPYFDMSLYKLGWSYYNQNNYSKAISSFIYLIEDISLVEKAKTQVLSKSKTDLRLESIHYIASCFTEFGGPKGAKEFLLKYKDKDYTLPILLKMSELYQKRNYYAEAIETYKAILELYPYYSEAPEIYHNIITNYEAGEDYSGANKTREELVDKLGPGSNWISQNPDTQVQNTGLAATRETLVYLGGFFQAEAQTNGNKETYLKAIAKYLDYLKKFPDDENVPKINYYLAECYYNIQGFTQAADCYYNVVIKDFLDKTGFREEAAYNRILCYYELMDAPGATDEKMTSIANFLGTNDTLVIVNINKPAEINILQASNDFLLTFPKSKWLDQVMMKYGEILHSLKYFLPAIEVYKKVLQLGNTRPYYLTASMSAGQCYFDAELFYEAEIWFNNIARNYPDSTRYTKRAQILASSANFKIAEQLSDAGKNQEAAKLLSTVADKAVEPGIQERAIFEAAAQYQKAGQPAQAATILERLITLQPSSKLADEALKNAAEIRENNKESASAAHNYLLLADNYPSSKYTKRSIINAAVCYENLQDWFSAKATFNKFITTFPDSGDDYIECMYKVGEMNYKLNDYYNAENSFKNTILAYDRMVNNGQELDTYFIAQAQFMLGEIYFISYKQINLIPPLETNLKLKVASFQKVLKAYKDALLYQVADWSTAATFKIGMTFEELFRAFIESPPPAELTGDQLTVYVTALKEKAEPYKQQALETYKLNVEQAATNNISNNWIDESKKRIEALSGEAEINNDILNSADQESVTQGINGKS